MEPLLVVLGLLYLTAPLVAWIALGRVRRLSRLQAELLARVQSLEAQLGLVPAVPVPQPESEPVRPDAPPEPAVWGPIEPQAAPEPEAAAEPPPVAAAAAGGGTALEADVAQRWLVWLGGIALALGGIFLAGWAIEQGWLGPRLKVGAAAVLGFVLLALGERARLPAASTGRTDHVAPALAAGGLCALYGATLAAHLLYALVGVGPAFALLALVSVLGIGLGLRYGPIVALLGSLGAYAAPLFVATDAPSPWPLFLFLGVLAPGLLVLARAGGWAWLGWLNLAGALFWQAAGLASGLHELAPAAPALHLLLLAAGALALLLLDEAAPAAGWLQRQDLPAFASIAGSALALLVLLLATRHASAPLILLAVLSAMVLAASIRSARLAWLVAILAATDLLAAATWRIPPLEPMTQLRDPTVGLEPLLWIAPEAAPLAWGLAAIAAVYGIAGYVTAGRSPRPGFWAGLSGTVPLLALAVAYWRLAGLAVSPGFSVLALGLAALALAAAERMARHDATRPALAAYAITVIAALALGATMALEAAWLTVALAVLLPAMAWVGRRLELDALRGPAWVLAGIVLARMLLDGAEAVTATPWLPFRLTYAYGAPLLAFWQAARLFRRDARDPLATLLEAGALLFWVMLLSAQLHGAITALGGAAAFGLAEAAALVLAWLATSLGLLRWHAADRAAPVPRIGWVLLALAAGALALGGSLVDRNPVLTGDPVGRWPILNLLLLAYGLPALLLALMARELRRQGDAKPALGMLVASQVMGLVWLTLEVRRFFQGASLDGPTGDGEWLAWSAAWLLWAGALLGIGIVRDNRLLRGAALVVAGLAIGKAFLFDFAELTGLYRAVSFLALGLALVGVGWLYRRFVAAPGPAAVAPPTTGTAGA